MSNKPLLNIDVKQTTANAKRVLKAYCSLKRIAKAQQLRSQRLSNMPKYHSNENQQEKKTTARLIAAEEFAAINAAIATLGADAQRVLKGCYCGEVTETSVSIYMDIGVAKSTYSRIKRDALIQFAEAYEYEELLVFN